MLCVSQSYLEQSAAELPLILTSTLIHYSVIGVGVPEGLRINSHTIPSVISNQCPSFVIYGYSDSSKNMSSGSRSVYIYARA